MGVVNYLLSLPTLKTADDGNISTDLCASVPFSQSYETCCLFADVSGFTALCEAMTQKFPAGGGEEYLAKHLNSYFELLVRILSSQGGDVFKFAGDALLVRYHFVLPASLLLEAFVLSPFSSLQSQYDPRFIGFIPT